MGDVEAAVLARHYGLTLRHFWVVWRVYGSKYLQLKLRCRSLDLGPKKSCVSPLSSRSVHSLYMDVSFVHRVRAVRALAGDPGVSQCRGGCGVARRLFFTPQWII